QSKPAREKLFRKAFEYIDLRNSGQEEPRFVLFSRAIDWFEASIYDFAPRGTTMHMHHFSRPVLAAVAFMVLFGSWANAQTQWSLAWSDEFNGAANTAPDPNNWSYDSPTAGSSNNELEIYCGQAGAGQTGDCSNWLKNGYMDGAGNLVIAAVLMPDGQWTSARIFTHGHFTFTYGRAEARIKLPSAAVLWPA